MRPARSPGACRPRRAGRRGNASSRPTWPISYAWWRSPSERPDPISSIPTGLFPYKGTMSGDDDGLREYVTSRLPSLRRSAFLMCGDWELATELTDACLARVVDGIRRGAVADADVWVYADLMEVCRRRNRRREH